MTATNFARVDSSSGEPLALPTGDAGEELVRYFLSSAIALLGDMGVYLAALQLGLSYPIAAAAGFVVGLWAAYTLSVRWAFRTRRVNDPQIEFLLFTGIGILGLGLTELLLWVLIGSLHLPALMAKVATAGAVFFFNFGLRKALLFTRSLVEVKP